LLTDLAAGLCLKYVLITEIKNMKKLNRIVQRKVFLSVPSENVKHLTCISKQCSAHLVEELDCITAESKNGKVLMNLVGTHIEGQCIPFLTTL
jgi:hypothetical protein